MLDSIAFDRLPTGLGRAGDFTYRFQRVDFVARVWESRIPQGWRVDLDLDVMRGARLTSGSALHDWFIGYEQRDPEPAYRPVSVHGRPGWLCRDQLFWLQRPGLAVSVQVDPSRWSRGEVVRAARSAHELSAPPASVPWWLSTAIPIRARDAAVGGHSGGRPAVGAHR